MEIDWYTCIVFNPNHVTSVQYFFTRAHSAAEAEGNALNWVLDGDPEMRDPNVRDLVEVPIVFKGRHEPVNE
jgi:hypothetical protein